MGRYNVNKKTFKKDFLSLLNEDVDGLDLNGKIKIVKKYVFEIEQNQEHDESNKGNEWKDEDLQVIFALPATKENCLKLAQSFNRGYGSIVLIYRWAAKSDKEISELGRSQDKFIMQIRRVAKDCALIN